MNQAACRLGLMAALPWPCTALSCVALLCAGMCGCSGNSSLGGPALDPDSAADVEGNPPILLDSASLGMHDATMPTRPADGGVDAFSENALLDGGSDGSIADASTESGAAGGARADGSSPYAVADAGADALVCDPSKEPKDAPCLVDDAYGVFVAPPASGGDDVQGDGSKATPFATITKALSNTNGKAHIYVCNAAYPEQVTMTIPVSLHGGFLCPRTDAGSAWSYVGSVARIVSPRPDYALTLSGVNGVADAISDMELAAPDRTTQEQDPSGNGKSSVAAVVNYSIVTFRRVLLVAGRGADGRSGDDGALTPNYPPSEPTAPQGRNADIAGGAGGGMACRNFDTSLGGVGAFGAMVFGGPGSATPSPPPTVLGNGMVRDGAGGSGGPMEPCWDANAGADGLTRPAGTATISGALTSGGWVPASGGSGGAGAPGQGGGGGGMDFGMALPGGSSGGCGGTGGGGGGGGGASIALTVSNSTVKVVGSTLIAGGAGNGGAGGSGQTGQGGGDWIIGRCRSGAGGNGAGGSGGAGGPGGVSVGILYSVGLRSPPVVDSTTSIIVGSPGRPGLHGAGGASGANSLLTGNSGNDGSDGLAGKAVQIWAL